MSKLRSQLDRLAASQNPKLDTGSIQYAANPAKESISQENRRELAEIKSAVQELAEKLFATENWRIAEEIERNVLQNPNSEFGKQPAQSSVNAINPVDLADTLATSLRENIHEQIAMLLRVDDQLEVLVENARAVVASASVETDTNDGEAFERIEARISSLAKSVENLSLDSLHANENSHTADLIQMPGQLQTIGAQPDLRFIESRLGSIEEQFAAIRDAA